MSLTKRIRVMLVDDHPIMRDGLRDALQDEGDFEVVGSAGDGVEAVTMAQGLEPEVIVMDVIMPNKDGVDACREIMELLPDTRVLMLTASTTEDAVIEAIAAGATGYLQKHSGPEELAEAIREVAQGRLRIPDKAIRRVFELIRGQRGLTANRALERMTAVEREILTLFASGRSYAQIAEARGNKTVSVRNAVYRIQDKVGVHSKQELVVWAVRNGLLDDVAAGDGAATAGGEVTRPAADEPTLPLSVRKRAQATVQWTAFRTKWESIRNRPGKKELDAVPTVSASPLTITAWWPMPAGHSWCGNSSGAVRGERPAGSRLAVG